jgi:hypothetical protein
MEITNSNVKPGHLFYLHTDTEMVLMSRAEMAELAEMIHVALDRTQKFVTRPNLVDVTKYTRAASEKATLNNIDEDGMGI